MNLEIYQYVQQILRKECLVKCEIFPESEFRQNLRLDSVGAMTLMASIESHYQINFDPNAIPPVRVADLVALIEKLSEQNRSIRSE